MKRVWSEAARAAVVAIAVVALNGASPEAQGRGRSGRQDTAPMAGALRGAEAAKAIRAKHAREGKPSADADTLVGVIESDESAWVTTDGQVFFSDVVFHETPGPEPGPEESSGPTAGTPPVPLGYTDAGIPIHHSSPGSVFKLYLDFDGDFLSSREWGITRQLVGYTLDSSRTTFNHEEQELISRVWGRIAEDFAPFDIDVTTERPIELQRGHPGERNVLWSIFTTASSAGFSHNVAGVSLFSMGYVPFGTTTPTFTFFNTIGPRDHDMLADVATQENGHMFGLLHDGLRFPGGGCCLEYYGGHGSGATSWGPVMGAPIRRNVTQWSLADYPNGTNPPYVHGVPFDDHQDDIAIIAGKLGFRADDVGDAPPTAAPVRLGSRYYINSSSDVDVFALPPTAVAVDLHLSGYRDGGTTDGGNVDIAAEIVNAAGLVIASVDDHEQTTATLAAEFPPGAYFLRVHSSSNPLHYTTYGSVGEYAVTGTITRLRHRFSGFDAPLPAEVMKAGRTVPVKFALQAADGSGGSLASVTAVAELWSDAPLAGDPVAVEECSGRSADGVYHCNLKLPKALVPGRTYWITARYLDGDERLLPVGEGNPLAFVAK